MSDYKEIESFCGMLQLTQTHIYSTAVRFSCVIIFFATAMWLHWSQLFVKLQWHITVRYISNSRYITVGMLLGILVTCFVTSFLCFKLHQFSMMQSPIKVVMTLMNLIIVKWDLLKNQIQILQITPPILFPNLHQHPRLNHQLKERSCHSRNKKHNWSWCLRSYFLSCKNGSQKSLWFI